VAYSGPVGDTLICTRRFADDARESQSMLDNSMSARLGGVLTTLVAIVGLSLSGVMAQTPDDTACSLDPVTLPLFDATPAASIASTPVVSTTDSSFDEIRDAIAVLAVCMNSGDAAFQYAIFTDRYLASLFADPTMTYQPEFEEQIALGPIQPEGQLRIVDVAEIDRLYDGRVSVTVTIASAASTFEDTLILANVDGVWLIDDVVELNPPR